MSRWLSSVGNLLEQLDSRAETVAQDDDEAPMDDNLNDILAKRGLSAEELKEETAAAFNESVGAWGEDEDMMDNVMDPSESAHEQDEDESQEVSPAEQPAEPAEGKGVSKEEDDNVTAKNAPKEQEPNPASVSENDPQKEEEEVKPQPPAESSKGEREKEDTQDQAKEVAAQSEKKVSENATKAPAPPTSLGSSGPPPTSGSSSTQPPPPPKPTPKPTSSVAKPPPPTPHTPPRYAGSAPKLPIVNKKELVEAQKEARTLRRHVVSLNTELEAAESELSAQRVELERAAERMEKDRVRTKEEKEKLVKQHAEELKTLKAQQEQALKEKQARMEEQMKTYRNQMMEMEDIRKQEGGDWNKELEQSIDRVQEMNQQVDQLQEEKSTLLSQITTLQGQQEMLGSRLESLTQTADSAMEREREADERLDAALSVHAKQISQRQSREAELERTVQELGAALVARNREHNRINTADRTNSDGSEPNDLNSFRARVEALESDLESANAHLVLERERSQTMQKELREMSKETTQEASSVYAKQLHYDRQIADLNVTISKLQSSLREAERNPSSESKSDDGDMANQVKTLSEEVLRLREKVASFNSESLAMRNRLKSAMDRAAKAEDHLAEARTSAAASASNDDFDSMERGPTGNGMGRRRRGGGNQSIGSIRSTLRLEPGQGEGREHLGKVVDVVDGFAVTTGKLLRRNPLARAGFIFYLLLIHGWTFVLIFLHAHSFETVHGDFGAGISVPHSPHALMQQQSPQDILQQVQQAKPEVEVPP